MNDFLIGELAKEHHRRILRAAETETMRRAAERDQRVPSRQRRRRRLQLRDR